MFPSIMRFINRNEEMEVLVRLLSGTGGRLAVVYGRRRIGKTRLLLEWAERNGGLYTVADQSAPEVQRRYFASTVAQVLPGFADVEYPDWASLFSRLARDARARKWHGPLVIDELPYLAFAAPEIASVLQRFIDHEAKAARLTLALAGSSQRMMQGLVLAASAPLYGRAEALFEVKPLSPRYLPSAFGKRSIIELVQLYAAWGGVPRYWELAVEAGNGVESQIDALVLNPLGPLHTEPDRLLLEEVPSAVELRPILDTVGQGVHRASEIAGRIGWKATSLSRPLQRLQELGLISREVPYGEPEHLSKRSLYKLNDPFARLWFRVVAPNRGRLASSKANERIALLRTHWPILAALAWEELCRTFVTDIDHRSALGRLGPWRTPARWWRGNAPEWDLVSASDDGKRLLTAEVKWSARPFDVRELERLAHETARKLLPAPALRFKAESVVRALLVPEVSRGAPRVLGGVHIVRGRELLMA
ncbi:MAG: ATP-binding protein [Polyangiaceae bacterium]|nr:ATP-binding protein [Polyangiaceae bacterium]